MIKIKTIKLTAETAIAVVVFLLIFTILIGFVIDQPAMLLLSYFGLYISAIAFFYDNTILNSFVAPLFTIYLIIGFADAFYGAYYALAVHVPIIFLSLYVFIFRRDRIKRFFYLLSTMLYVNWLLTIAIWFPGIALGLPLMIHLINYVFTLTINFTIGFLYIKKQSRRKRGKRGRR